MIHTFDSLYELKNQDASFYKETDIFFLSRIHPDIKSTSPYMFRYVRDDNRDRILGCIEPLYKNKGRLVSDKPYTMQTFCATGENKTAEQQGITQWWANLLWGIGVIDVTKDTCDDGAFQHGLKALQNKDIRFLSGEGKKYFLNKSGELESDVSMGGMFGIEHMNLVGDHSITAIKRKATNQSDALGKLIIDRPYFRHLNLEFFGKGIDWDCGFNGGVYHSSFFACDIGLNAEFWLGATAEDNMFTNCLTSGDIWNNGSWPGATLTNSQCNSLYYIKNRHFTKDTAHSATEFRVLSGLIADGNIYEGGGGDHAIIFDSEASTVVRECNFRGLHIEAPFNIDMIKIKSNSGIYVIDTVFCQYGNIVDFDVHSGYPEIQIKNWVWDVYGNVKFKHNNNGCHWLFENNQFCPQFVDDVEPYFGRWAIKSDTYNWYQCGGGSPPAKMAEGFNDQVEPPYTQEELDALNLKRLALVAEKEEEIEAKRKEYGLDETFRRL